jgi:hypothetical protein
MILLYTYTFTSARLQSSSRGLLSSYHPSPFYIKNSMSRMPFPTCVDSTNSPLPMPLLSWRWFGGKSGLRTSWNGPPGWLLFWISTQGRRKGRGRGTKKTYRRISCGISQGWMVDQIPVLNCR